MDTESTPPPVSDDTLQFDEAEPAQSSLEGAACTACRQPVDDTYYAVNGQVVCGPCVSRIQAAIQGGSRAGRFFRALIYGGLAAALGAIIYFLILYVSGYEFALVAIVVGFMVGAAVRRGCGGRGGWAYQLLAIALTYSSIVVTYVPMLAKGMAEHFDVTTQPAAAATGAQHGASQPASESAASSESAELGTGGKVLVGALGIVLLFIVACLAPFLAAAEGQHLIGLLIIAFALYEAWKLNKRVHVEILGPYQVTAEVPASPEQGQDET